MDSSIFIHRKDLKKSGHCIVRKHYFVLAFLTLILVLFGAEYRFVLMGWEQVEDTDSVSETDNILSSDGLIPDGSVLQNLQPGADSASEGMFGRTNGVLAEIVNGTLSDGLLSRLGQIIWTITRSDKTVNAVFVIGAYLWYGLFFIFFKNVYSAVMRRMFLEARVYEQVSILNVTHFAAVRKWIHASLDMLLVYVYQVLWSLTIVGGVIKWHSYWAVPWIVAENPAVPAKEAISLSRRMMNGHKLELLKYRLSFAGWVLLGIFTNGISDLVYGLPYRMACYSEFYARIREEAVSASLEGTEWLNDRYLFEKADKVLLYETYFDVVDDITYIHEKHTELTGPARILSKWFGIWIGSIRRKKNYDAEECGIQAIHHQKLCMTGKAYPQRLCPLWRKKETEKHGRVTYLHSYTLWTLFILFISLSFLGWIWEVALHYMQAGELVNRGTLHGPWLPIYGSGGVIVLMLCNRFRRNPVAEFFSSVLLCGTLEYFSGWYLEMRYHRRWWSYDGYFLNLHGRICAEGLLIFGVGCCIVVYLVAPLFDYVLSRCQRAVLIGLSLVLGILYFGDVAYSDRHPNMAKGAIEETACAGYQNLPEITGRVPDFMRDPVKGRLL